MDRVPDFSHTPDLIGERVLLRAATRADVAVLAALMADPEVTRLTGSAHGPDDPGPAYALAELERIYAGWAEAEDRLVWVVVDRGSDQVVGEALLTDLDAGNRGCGFRIWISGARDRGLGTEATRLVTDHAISVGVHRVELEVYAFNPRARHVYERCGFVLEGTRRDALLWDGAWVDCHVMSRLATEA